MNFKLTEQIIRHIYSNLGILNKLEKSKSLIDKEYILNAKLKFENEFQGNVYGCTVSLENKNIKLLLGNCSQDKIPEYCLIMSMNDAPIYGLYLIYNDLDKTISSSPLIAANINKQWGVCNTYLQATFLAGMEQLKDFGFNWIKCEEYLEEFEMMKSFINYYDEFYQ